MRQLSRLRCSCRQRRAPRQLLWRGLPKADSEWYGRIVTDFPRVGLREADAVFEPTRPPAVGRLDRSPNAGVPAQSAEGRVAGCSRYKRRRSVSVMCKKVSLSLLATVIFWLPASIGWAQSAEPLASSLITKSIRAIGYP